MADTTSQTQEVSIQELQVCCIVEKTLETDMRPSAHNYFYLLARRWLQLAVLPFVSHVGLISGTISWVVCKVN